MLIKLEIAILLISIFTCNLSYAKEYYVFIEKTNPVNKDDGQSLPGEVIAISETKPNANELKNQQVIVMDLTIEEVQQLLMTDTEGKKEVKLDVDKLQNIADESKVDETQKQDIMDNLLSRDVTLVEPK